MTNRKVINMAPTSVVEWIKANAENKMTYQIRLLQGVSHTPVVAMWSLEFKQPQSL